jgi:hypothetical protein
VLAEGLDWGVDLLRGWMNDVIRHARTLGSAPLVAYLEDRRALHDEVVREMAAGVRSIRGTALRVR